MKVTLTALEKHDACVAERRRFAELFPDGVRVTVARCVRYADEFDWAWAARHLIPGANGLDTTESYRAWYRLVLPTWNGTWYHGLVAGRCLACFTINNVEATAFARVVNTPSLRTPTPTSTP